ncbi:FAD-dependent monooxygenase [Methylobacterium sp. NEAU 140]|uniref:FAD binding domain-containing protein n=1 Tax=Methylobacterium sp. NEAU 140 TaxID=3064945 RepID=UPI002732DE3E|nr:FAD-dependent monooxygenase [Methylobacterium sp. NEAU 140]MDP4022992.1 FAD-dependent monooxygenase [Methylobacterium sp. NEAU 140]
MRRLAITVIGGSIAGLTAARLLSQAGHAVSVHERSAEPLAGRGAGIVTHPGLHAVLARCGVPVAPRDLGVTVAVRRVLDRDGRVVAERALPQVLAGWGRLHALLRETLPGDAVRLGARLVAVERDGDAVVARFADGGRVAGDLLVGADGLHSSVRAGFLPGVAPAYAGYVAWRAVVDMADLARATRAAIGDHFAFCLPPGEQILGYPVSGADADGRPGARLFNAVWYRPAPAEDLAGLMTDTGGARHALSIPPNRIRPEVLAAMRAEAERVLAPPFADVMRRAPSPFLQAILDLEMPSMAPAPGVALLGDAAFVARPHVGMGVTKAMEDAAALTDAVSAADGDVRAALRTFDARRRPYGAAVVARGRELGAYLQAQRLGAAERAAAERYRSPEAVMDGTAVPPAGLTG